MCNVQKKKKSQSAGEGNFDPSGGGPGGPRSATPGRPPPRTVFPSAPYQLTVSHGGRTLGSPNVKIGCINCIRKVICLGKQQSGLIHSGYSTKNYCPLSIFAFSLPLDCEDQLNATWFSLNGWAQMVPLVRGKHGGRAG